MSWRYLRSSRTVYSSSTDCTTCGRELELEGRFRYQEIYGVVREVVDDNGGEYQCKCRSVSQSSE